MALNKPRLTLAIKAALDADSPINQDSPADNAHLVAKRLAIATALADAIIEEIKQATVVYSAGLVAAGSPVTGTFTHTIT